MSQIDLLLFNIDEITNTVIDIGEKINQLSSLKSPKLTFSDASGTGMFKFMTDRQIAKKVVMMFGNMTGLSVTELANTAVTDNVPVQGQPIVNKLAGQEINSIDQNIAHLMVYGKFLYDANGQLVDNEILFPKCVAGEGKGESGITHMSVSFPLLVWIKDLKKEFKNAIASLRIKAGELAQAYIDMQFQLVLAITTLASAATILPPGSGLPTALSAVKSIPTALMAFQTRILQLLPLLKPLSYAKVLIPIDKLDPAIAPINVVLKLILRPFVVIDVILTLVAALAGATPPVPGVDGVPPDPLKLNLTAEPSSLPLFNPNGIYVDLKAGANGGSYHYYYQWSSSPAGLISNNKNPTHKPTTTTTYTVKVLDTKTNEQTTSSITVNLF